MLNVMGVSTSNCFKLSLLCTDENLAQLDHLSNSSFEALNDYIQNEAFLVGSVRENSNDKDLYFNCAPDGLCSVRAARLATRRTVCSDAKDVNIKNRIMRKVFLRELEERLIEVGGDLDAEQRQFIDQVIHRLSAGMTNTMIDGARGVRWPDESFLVKWMRPEIKWNFFSLSTMHGDGWDTLNFVQICFNFNEYYPISGMLLGDLITALNGNNVGIKFRNKHFYFVPQRVVDLVDITSTVKNLVENVMKSFIVVARVEISDEIIAPARESQDECMATQQLSRKRKSYLQQQRRHACLDETYSRKSSNHKYYENAKQI